MHTRTVRSGIRGAFLAGLSLFAITAASLAFAQPPEGPPPPGGGPGGQGGFGPPPGGPGRPGMGGPRMSPANAPLSALDAELTLSDSQKQEIKQIQDKFHKDQRALMPGFGGPPNGGPPGGGPGNGGPTNGGPGGPPDFQQMQAMMQKVRALDESASRQIVAVLTDAQKSALPNVMRELNALRPAGIPLEILGSLKLTSDQKRSITGIAEKSQQDLQQRMAAAQQSGDFQQMRDIIQSSRETAHRQVMAALTQGQRTMVENFIKEHPMRGRGGPGGFGGPGGGPPPPGGPGGDPPPPPGE